jgi:hypothetical protein
MARARSPSGAKWWFIDDLIGDKKRQHRCCLARWLRAASDGLETDLAAEFRADFAAELRATCSDSGLSANLGFQSGVHFLRWTCRLGVLAEDFEAQHLARVEINFAH